MNKYNENDLPHGYWEHYWSDFTYSELHRTIRRKGYYNKGEPHGYWEFIRMDGSLYRKEFYL